MNVMLFYSDLYKQALEVTFLRTMRKSYHSQFCINSLLGMYLNEKWNFYDHICVCFIIYNFLYFVSTVTDTRSHQL